MNIFNNKRILIISPEPWHHDFISKHHYAIILAKENNDVYFLNPPSTLNNCMPTDISNLQVLNYKPYFRGLNNLPTWLSFFFWKAEISKIEKLAKCKFQIVWSFDPFRFQLLTLFKSDLFIYYAADVHANTYLETVIANNAHLVLSPSQKVLNRINTVVQKMKINHGVSDYFFFESRKIILPGDNKIKIGYVGNLQSKYISYTLINNAVQGNPNCDFIFVGERGSAQIIREAPNVYFLGKKPNHLLPEILKSCDVLLLAYDTNLYWDEASNAHKIMEYLATGRVVVSTRISEYIDSNLLVIPEHNDQLPMLLNEVVSKLEFYNSKNECESRITFARTNTYKALLVQIDDILYGIEK